MEEGRQGDIGTGTHKHVSKRREREIVKGLEYCVIPLQGNWSVIKCHRIYVVCKHFDNYQQPVTTLTQQGIIECIIIINIYVCIIKSAMHNSWYNVYQQC